MIYKTREKLEKEIEKAFVKKIKELNGLCFKWVSPGNSGVPDRIVILDSGEIIFIELKTKYGKLSSIQKGQIEKLREKNQKVTVLYGLSGVSKFLAYLKMSRLDLIENEMR